MKFCYNCGSALSGTEKFCGQCGARIEHIVAPQVQPEPQTPASAPQEEVRQKARACSRHGIIFTNIEVLASNFRCNRKLLTDVLNSYASMMTDADIEYRVVDASDYMFISNGAGRRSEHVSLNSSNNWIDYQHILYDIICYEKENSCPESNYLFIIGGHDVIPVAAVNHYISDEPDFSDKDIETDILYAYPYGPHTQSALESQQLYKQEMYFLVGRLPVPVDADLSYLINYFENVQTVMGGIPVSKVYAQCDPHWKELTAYLMSPFNKAGMLPDRGNISGRFCYGNVMLGPEITSEHIASVMEKDTNLIYLNLHGSDDPDNSGYLGELPPKTHRYYEIFPTSAMSIPNCPNVFVAEACYGGRFIGYDEVDSMILAGLSHSTVLGLASSRIAFGTAAPPASSADVICINFVMALVSGYSAGESMVIARRAFFGEDGMLSDMGATTLAEFNLFGDPSLRVRCSGGHKSVPVVDRKVAPANFPVGYETKVIKSASQKQSLLDMVRGAVDANVQAISDTIGKELYEKYGLPPREPQTIKKVKYANGKERLMFSYSEKKDVPGSSVNMLWRVTATTDGKIESVLTSK